MKPTADGRKPSPGKQKSGNNSIAEDIFKRNWLYVEDNVLKSQNNDFFCFS